ncbi:MAG: cystathionine beta-lyase [Alphaproteobacteria bacterium]|nr:cystathionine beta-lyase [Alphaproteobacteria bacterium]
MSSSKTGRKKDATIMTHAGMDPQKHHGALNVPPYRMSTVAFSSLEEFMNNPSGTTAYGRTSTPSMKALEDAITALENAHGSVIAPSGLSAIVTAITAFTGAGDHVLITDNCYGPSRRAAENIFKRFGLDVEYYSPMMGAEIETLFRTNTKVLFMESPGSLTFEVQDIGAMTAATKKVGIKTILDNSWATPLYLKPLDLGIDVAMMSGTKYVSGHSDALIGTLAANAASYDAVRNQAIYSGICAGSEEIYLTLRGLRTMGVRMAHHSKAALDIAHWLAGHPAVKRVLHPALPSCPGHENWKKYFKGASGTFSLVLHEGERSKIAKMLDGMELFRMGFSWGGFESLIVYEEPASARTASPWTETGGLIRLHIGLEDIDDLKADIEAGFTRLS